MCVNLPSTYDPLMIISKSDTPAILMELAFVGIKLAGFARVLFLRSLQGSDE